MTICMYILCLNECVYAAPPMLEEATRHNLTEKLSNLILDGEIVTITDPMLMNASLSIQLYIDHKRQKQ